MNPLFHVELLSGIHSLPGSEADSVWHRAASLLLPISWNMEPSWKRESGFLLPSHALAQRMCFIWSSTLSNWKSCHSFHQRLLRIHGKDRKTTVQNESNGEWRENLLSADGTIGWWLIACSGWELAWAGGTGAAWSPVALFGFPTCFTELEREKRTELNL